MIFTLWDIGPFRFGYLYRHITSFNVFACAIDHAVHYLSSLRAVNRRNIHRHGTGDLMYGNFILDPHA